MDNMVKIVHLPTEQLRNIKSNPFPELSAEEYKDLKESISRYGILEPLIVIKQNGSSYEVISGNHRLRVAKEIGLKNVPCSIIDLGRLEGAFDTEIFRRHLNKAERDKFIKIKKDGARRRVEQELSCSLIPDLYKMYNEGTLQLEDAIFISYMDVERQKVIFNRVMKSIQKENGEKEEEAHKLELSNLQKKIEELEKKLAKKEEELLGLKKWKEEKKEEIEKRMKQLQKEKEASTASVKEKIEGLQERYDQLWTTNETLRQQIRKKEMEIEEIKQERDKAKEALKRKEEEKKIEKTKIDIELVEKKRSFWLGVINRYTDTLTETLSNLDHCDTDCLLNKQISNIRKEIQKIMHRLWKFDEKLASQETRLVH